VLGTLRRTVSLALGVLILGACSVEVGFSTSPESDGLPSVSDIVPDDDSRSSLLLTLEEVAALPGAPESLVEVPNPPLSDNPDPRGVCGAKVDQPSFSEAKVVVFQASEYGDAAIVHAVFDIPEQDGLKLIRQLQRDIDPDCPSHVATTPNGTQRVVFVDQVRLPSLAPDAVATRVVITVPGAPTTQASSSYVVKENHLSLIFTVSRARLPHRFVREAAVAAAAKL
jgi:hypothetical protein